MKLKTLMSTLILSAVVMTSTVQAQPMAQSYIIGKQEVKINTLTQNNRSYIKLEDLCRILGIFEDVEMSEAYMSSGTVYTDNTHHMYLKNPRNGKNLVYWMGEDGGALGVYLLVSTSKEGFGEYAHREILFGQNLYPLSVEGELYFPLKLVAEQLEINVEYKEGKIVVVEKPVTNVSVKMICDFYFTNGINGTNLIQGLNWATGVPDGYDGDLDAYRVAQYTHTLNVLERTCEGKISEDEKLIYSLQKQIIQNLIKFHQLADKGEWDAAMKVGKEIYSLYSKLVKEMTNIGYIRLPELKPVNI